MNLRLYGYWRSSSSWRVRIGLHLKGLDFEYRAVNLAGAGEQFAAAHLGRNPMAQVPVLEVEEGGRVFLLAQSMAILEYLEERFPTPPLLPSDALGRARVRMLAEHVNSGIQPYQNASTLRFLRERPAGGEGASPRAAEGRREEEQAWLRHWLGRGLSALERAVQNGRPPGSRFCHGNEPTLADVYLVPQLYGARRFHVDLAPLTTLLSIESSCRSIGAFARSEPERQPDAPPPDKR